jgi:hypothetical protein
MFEVDRITQLAQQLQVDVLAKVIFSFSPDIVMSPLCLPRALLEPWLDQLIFQTSGAMQDILTQLKSRQTFQEQWPDSYQAGLIRGKKRILQLEQIRKDLYTMSDILAERPDILEWWNQIEC